MVFTDTKKTTTHDELRGGSEGTQPQIWSPEKLEEETRSCVVSLDQLASLECASAGDSGHDGRASVRFKDALVHASEHPKFLEAISAIDRSIADLHIATPWGISSETVPHPGLLGDNVPQFDFQRFYINLVSEMAVNLSGAAYCFVLCKDKKFYSSFARGNAFGPSDSKDSKFRLTIDQPVNIASVSKVLTAAAVLKALEQKGDLDKALDDKIWQYFPQRWKDFKINVDFAEVSFRNCLQYMIGPIDQNGGQSTNIETINSWFESGQYIGYHLNKDTFGDPNYQTYNNISIAWFRIALFYFAAEDWVVKYLEGLAHIFATQLLLKFPEDEWLNYFVSQWYIRYVRKAILNPIGVQLADMCHVSEFDSRPLETKKATQTRYYPYPLEKASNGEEGLDWTSTGGGGGWVISARDLARFWAHLRGGLILSGSATDRFFNVVAPDESFAVFPDVTNGHGLGFWKRGQATEFNGGYCSQLWDLPGGVQLTFVSNCNINPSTNTTAILKAYKEAWK